MAFFLLSSLMIFLMLVAKSFFFGHEQVYASSLLGKIELVAFALAFLTGLISFFLDLRKLPKETKLKTRSKKINKVTATAMAVIIGVSLLFTFFVNYSKQSIHWDALALYDARAKFIASGVKFSEMPALSTYDNLNKYYYLLYPPFTSIVHYFWMSSPSVQGLPVGLFYSVNLLVLVMVVYAVTKKDIGVFAALLLSVLIATNPSLVNVTIKEYTNLPFSLYIVSGVFLLYLYLKSKKYWQLIFGIILIASSGWIRLLEPVWLGVFIAFAAVLLVKKTRGSMLPILLMLGMCVLEFIAWNYFVKGISDNPGFLEFKISTVLNPVIGIFTGVPLTVLFVIIKFWRIPFFIVFFAIVVALLRWRKTKADDGVLFLTLVLIFSFLMYFSEFYLLSFQHDWWTTIALSLDRSATFLIPIAAFLAMKSLMSRNS